MSSKDTDVGFTDRFEVKSFTYNRSLKCIKCNKKNPSVMNRVNFRDAAQARIAARLRQVLVLFAAVVVGMLVSVSVNF